MIDFRLAQNQRLLSKSQEHYYQTIRQNIDEKSKKSKTIGVSSFNINNDKTTCAFQLALSYAKSGQLTLFIDTDEYSDMSSKLLDSEVKDYIGFSDFLFDHRDGSYLIKSTEISLLKYIPVGNIKGNGLNHKTISRFKHLIHEIEPKFDNIIINIPNFSHKELSYDYCQLIDRTLVIVDSDQCDIKEINKLKEELGQKLLGIVMINVDNATESKYAHPQLRGSLSRSARY
ncbi:capsular exopolysaccharide family protein [Streptococcus urinalis FB127-CNA-2]|uniref:Capsular exopolysaccharide family n=1 Tax=Streptococcus urinalis 2285-97 TaxID=764291 RepID=G5KGL0_9STRE|nr:hypothetical protein [Streptococcus urinalis]EHJ57326.1 capsular exopolysaccharide family [Streptococcus urinalis 2285-97]EKS22378.1 capsular exopolysaccharide family protein [Streptococcus urinalis FB127-CNA-2]VEF32191.1 CpsD [Streptococcus urinalis]